MPTTVGIVEIIQWVTYIFPSFLDYTKIVAPILIFSISTSSVFFGILPKPNQTYPIPEIEDIDIQFKGSGIIIYKVILLSRKITIKVNLIICSKPYKWFYKSSQFVSSIVFRIKGIRKPRDGITISKPEILKTDFDTIGEKD